ncbi:MAG: glycoside hydrolase family 2 TIM barrel-domain containing protein [bacterium]
MTILALALLAGCSLASRYAGMHFWQTFLLLMPPCLLAIGLEWVRPAADYSRLEEHPADAIEDLESPLRKYLWLNGLWDFRLRGEKRWRRIFLPRSLSTIPGLGFYKGGGAFRRVFSVPAGWSLGRVILHFRGVNHHAEVLLDGRRIGVHDGGHTPFEMDVTNRIRDSRERELEVRVSNELSRSTVPNVAGWRNEGGILREVYLETVPEVYIRDVYIMAEPDLRGRAAVALSVKIENPGLIPKDYSIEVLNPMGVVAHRHRVEGWTMQTLQHRFTLTFVSLWSAANPDLYVCRVSVDERGGDELSMRFGIKKVECREGDIVVNGKRVKLRCADRWEDYGGTGRVGSFAQIEADLKLMKEAGFNAVRLCPFPHHPAALEVCDRIGLYVLEEIPVWKSVVGDMVDPVYQQSAEQQLVEMLARDRNRASVLMWGLANDVDSDTKEGRWFIERLVRVARGLDSRPVYIVSSEGGEEQCADLVDVLGVSFRRLAGGARGEMEREIREWREWFPGKQFFVVDFGAQGMGGGGPRVGDRFSREHQARMVQDFVLFAEEDEDVAGWSVASLADHWSPGAFANPRPFFSEEGLVTHGREKKLAYEVVRRLLAGEEKVRIEREREFLPATWFSWLVFVGALAAAFYFVVREPGMLVKLAWIPGVVLEEGAAGWKVLLFMTVFNSLGWAVMINRFFRAAPQNLIGSIDMPVFSLISWLLRAEWRLFVWTYATVLVLWMLMVTLLELVFPDMGFFTVLNRTAVISLPDVLFVLPAFFRVPLWFSALAFHAWKLVLAYGTLGVGGMVVYVVIGPLMILIGFLVLMELKFHVFKYLRKLL